ncbi:MAG: MBL fold metallo-hydrolase [Promethearchaeota archaeon]
MLEPISENIFLVQGMNKGRFPFSHSILIFENENKTVLIDTGCGLEILKELKKKYNISYIINSHTHPDHSAGNWLFKDRPIYVPEEGFNTSGNLVALSERLAEPGELAKYWRDYVTTDLGIRDCRPTHKFNANSVFEFGKVVLQSIHTPGHTNDHYCFYEPNEKLLFAFDYDLTSFGPWYGHRESDIPDFKRSIKKLKELDVKILISGHKGLVTENIHEQLDKFHAKFDERDDNILELLHEGGKTIEELVEKAPIYGNFPYAEPLLRYWEGQMIKKHLEELEKQGKVLKRKKGLYSLKERN